MNKKEIIGIVNDVISKEIDKSVFGDDEKDGKIGCNQFRELSALCLKAECYEEIELQIKYNKAKISGNKSWNKKPINGKALADTVIKCMEKIKANSSEKDCLKNLSLMFGYFYWNARICTAENKENDKNQKQNDKNNYKEQNNGGYHKNNNGYKKNQFNNNQNGNYKGSNNSWKRG